MSKLPRRTNAKSQKKVDADKVGKLVRMLASDKDGEVLAAVAALKRTLGAGGADINDMADALVAGLKPGKPERVSWEPPPPDLLNWESMSWHCHFHSHRLRDDDRDFVVDVLLGRAGFDLGRATPELMQRLRSIVAKVKAARSAEGWR
jgi:hypothetical protein